MRYQTAPHGSVGLPNELYQLMLLTEGTALLLNGCFNPILQELKKTISKTNSI